MRQVTIARDRPDRVADAREALVYRQLETAMSPARSVVLRDVASLAGGRSLPLGLERIRPLGKLVAFGRAAHIGLAEFEKRTLLAADLELDADHVDIERLMWSSLNTTQAIALGRAAWRSMQLLPIDAIHVRDTPPLRMEKPADFNRSSVRIISHGRQPQAAAAATLLTRAGFIVVASDDGWGDGAAIHLHVGRHDLDATEPRLVDSWASGRMAIQIDDARTDETQARKTLQVDHERNGLVCGAIGTIAAMCEEVRADETFWGRLVKAGHKTVAPLLKGWTDIADEVLA